jgi:hypothetical protein
MAVTAKWYGTPIKNMFSGANVVDWDTDTIKIALVKSGYTPDQDAHDFFNDITEELATANGYTAGGATLVCSAPTYDSATNEMRLDATDPSWTATGAGITARYAIIYKSTGTSSTSPLIAYIDFGADNTAAAGSTFTIVFDATGVAKITAS